MKYNPDWSKFNEFRENHPNIPLAIDAERAELHIRHRQRLEQLKRRAWTGRAEVSWNKAARPDGLGIVHIYNIGPFQYTAMLGSWGTYHILPKPDDQPYSHMTVPDTFEEPTETPLGDPAFGDGGFDIVLIGGLYVAHQIVGDGPGLPSGNSMVQYGMFVGGGRGPSGCPTGEEYATAHRHLTAKCHELYEHANAMVEGDRGYNIGAQRFLAAKTIGLPTAHWGKKDIWNV